VFIRQILIEFHGSLPDGPPDEGMNEIFHRFSKEGYVIFHKEPNTLRCGGRCIEYGFLKLNLPA